MVVVERDLSGNAAKRLQDRSYGPWARWRTKSRHARAIRFMETYCRPPKGKGHGRPIRLARFQKQWLEEALAPGVDVAVQSIPRGNGKSTFRAALALWAVFDDIDTGAPQVPIVATTVGQAKKAIYTVASQMVAAEPELSRRSIPFTAWGSERLWVPSSDGEMFPIANDVGGLQGLDPSFGVVDELAFMPIEAWVALTESAGKRDHSLIAGISTPGFNRENALWHIRSQARGGVDMPGTVYSEFSADENCDLVDEDQWRKANPAIDAGFLRIEALRSSLGRTPAGMFRIFRLGQWVDGTECWLGADGGREWEGLADPVELVAGAPAWLGVDVGLKRDSTAVCVLQRRPDGRLHAKVRLWVPTADEAVDVTDVMHHIRELAKLVDVQGVSYDPRFFDVPAKMLEDEGLPLVEIPQSVERMTAAVGSTFEAIKRGELTHDGDQAVTTQVLNAVARFNERGFTLAKGKSRGRIDAAVAICLAVDLALRQEPPAEFQAFFG
jgi:phage terminase large subunit-like protein